MVFKELNIFLTMGSVFRFNLPLCSVYPPDLSYREIFYIFNDTVCIKKYNLFHILLIWLTKTMGKKVVILVQVKFYTEFY